MLRLDNKSDVSWNELNIDLDIDLISFNVGFIEKEISLDTLSFYNSFNVPVSIARPFNTYGPRQSARAVIPTIITQIANGSSQIKLGAISPTRDFNYVKDTVNAFISAMECSNGLGEVINFGSNFEISVGDTALLIAETMGVNIEIFTDEKRLRPKKSEVDRLVADNSKAFDYFGWKPAYGGKDGFKKGLIETIKWFENSQNLNMYKSENYNI